MVSVSIRVSVYVSSRIRFWIRALVRIKVNEISEPVIS